MRPMKLSKSSVLVENLERGKVERDILDAQEE